MAKAKALDGRHERKRKNIDRVIDAVYELWADGQLAPNAQTIAERSGVSLRSVFRYFDDLESLVEAAILRNPMGDDPHFDLVAPEGSFEQRCLQLAQMRVTYYDDFKGIGEALRHRTPLHPRMAGELAVRVARLNEQVEVLFAEELASFSDTERAKRLLTVETITGFDAVRWLRLIRELPFDDAADLLAEAVRRTLIP